MQRIREALLREGMEAMCGTKTIRWLLLCGLVALQVSGLGCAALRSGNGLFGRMSEANLERDQGRLVTESLPDLKGNDIVAGEPAGRVQNESDVIPDAVRLSELLQRAAEEPRCAQWQAELAGYWLQAGQLQEADSYAVRAIGLDQHCAAAWQVRAAVAMAKSEWSIALGCYQQAINSRGENVETLSQIAECYRQLGEPRRALSACERAIELSPGGIPGQQLTVQQGRVLAELGQSRRAISILENAVLQSDATAGCWLALSEAQVLAGEASAARLTLARAQELFPDSPQLERWQQAQVPGESPLAVWK
jgi:tetratricopeptide (TPR) repeat protein